MIRPVEKTRQMDIQFIFLENYFFASAGERLHRALGVQASK